MEEVIDVDAPPCTIDLTKETCIDLTLSDTEVSTPALTSPRYLQPGSKNIPSSISLGSSKASSQVIHLLALPSAWKLITALRNTRGR